MLLYLYHFHGVNSGAHVHFVCFYSAHYNYNFVRLEENQYYHRLNAPSAFLHYTGFNCDVHFIISMV